MNRTQAAAAGRAASIGRSSARCDQYRTHRESGLTQAQAASALGISTRQGQRYEQALKMRGWQPPPLPYEPRMVDLRKRILAHLDSYPNSALSYRQLARVADPLKVRGTVDGLLRRLAAEGVVETVIGEHDPGVDRRPARRYRTVRHAEASGAHLRA